ncbi:hypothetical protein [Reichenbachiella versicolor]|uniref:hypothetical protein n=1 Tax=Reichenbachiella versicolor TaxID=1821036 RepID=UPI000D6DF8A9|nr:hypothetical protein [Reichenbachiella versicolor]
MNFFLALMLVSTSVLFSNTQLLDIQEVRLDSIITAYLESEVVKFDENYIQNSTWEYNTGMNNISLEFSSRKFKIRSTGKKSKTVNRSGSWYIYDKYLVLDYKGEKRPMYVVNKGGRVIILDDHNVKIIIKLIMAFVSKEEWMGYLTKSDVFSFVDGFEKVD